MAKAQVIEGKRPDGSKLFASIDPAARYVTSRVAEIRFAALLTPFPALAEAQAALLDAGAEPLDGGQ